MLVTVVNHNHNQQAIRLRDAFAKKTQALLIDSGSRLSAEEEERVDIGLPNVYYTGLVNEAWRQTKEMSPDEILLFVSSDVELDNPSDLIVRAERGFEDKRVGVYAPSMEASIHLQMRTGTNSQLRAVVFVEGVVFAVRKKLFDLLCPIDPSVNRLGWALDVHLGYLTLKSGLRSVVDDGIQIRHAPGRGYQVDEAREQAEKWLASQGSQASRFWKISTQHKYQKKFGLWKTRIRCRL